MPNGFTITNMPEAAEPSTLAEVTALITAAGTALGGIIVPLVILLALWMFRHPISELIKNLSSLEGPGGVKVQTHERLGPATEAVEELTAEEIAAAEPPVVQPMEADAASGEATSEPNPPQEIRVEGRDERVSDNTSRDDHEQEIDHYLPKESLSPAASGSHSKWRFIAALDNQSVGRRTFADLLRIHPASAVLFEWNEVEAALRALAGSRGLAEEQLRVPPRILISRLKRLDAMPIELADLLREMMDVRSDALHQSGQISEKTALDFRRSAQVARREIARQSRLPSQADMFRVPVAG